MKLWELLKDMQANQVAKATYAITEVWYITKLEFGSIFYCNEYGTEVYDLVPLTFSNQEAFYEII